MMGDFASGDFPIHFAFYQDDLIITTDPKHRDQLVEAFGITLDVLREYSFNVRDDKTLIGVSSVVFCGYELRGKRFHPCPSRNKFSCELEDKLWTELEQAYSKRSQDEISNDAPILKWVRSVTGIFQDCYGFLGANELSVCGSYIR